MTFLAKIQKFIILLIVIFNSKISAQFAKVIDNDGYVNVRSDANIKSKVIGKIKSNEIVYIFNDGDEFGNWLIVDYYVTKDSLLTGYIHNSRVKPISSYQNIPSILKTKNRAEFSSQKIQVKINIENFDNEKNKIYFKTFQYTKYAIQTFKGQEIWGTDGTIPRTHYKSIEVKIGENTILIPQSELENLFNPNCEFTECYYDEKSRKLYITSMNSDGSGAYEVLFVIANEKYNGRKIYQAN